MYVGDGPVYADILPRAENFSFGGGGLGPACLFLRGKIINGTPHDLCAARMHGAQSACNRNPAQKLNACVGIFFWGGEGERGLGEM